MWVWKLSNPRRSRPGVGIAAAIFLSPWLAGQTPSGVDFTLALKDGKTTFRMGEAVNVEFRFTASVPNRYAVWLLRPVRLTRQAEFDHFTVEPAAGTADPLADGPAEPPGGAILGQAPRPAWLTANPQTVGLAVNEWLSIRKPGRYRITAETTRVVALAAQQRPLPLKSNSIEIEVVAAEPGWAEAQLKQAVATLEIPDPPPAAPGVGLGINTLGRRVHDQNADEAARTLRFLETADAVAPLVRFFAKGPAAAQAELRAGLYASPYRKEVMAAMEEAIHNPDVAITGPFMDALTGLAKIGTNPARTRAADAEYYAKLAEAVNQKHGAALATSLETLVDRGPQPAPPETGAALAANFHLLPEHSQWTFLTGGWYHIASPSITPLLQSIAQGEGNLRDAALLRLYELDPAAARRIALERIGRLDVSRQMYSNRRVLLQLPDKTLPDLDETLAAALEKNTVFADLLVARYASAGVAGRLKAWVEQSPARLCGSPVLAAYFFRVDAEWAAAAWAKAREEAGTGPVCLLNLAPVEDLLMSPGLEQQAIEDASSSNLAVAREGLTLLQWAGSKAVEKPLLEAFAHFHATVKPAEVQSRGVEQGFVSALLAASRWIPAEETFGEAGADCVSEICRRQVASARQALQQPIPIDIGTSPVPFTTARVGAISLRSDAQLADRLAQYPRDTQFYLTGSGEGTWYYQQRAAQVTKLVEAAGGKLVAR